MLECIQVHVVVTEMFNKGIHAHVNIFCRILEFPSLDSHKSAMPDESQLSAVDNLIDTMNLCREYDHIYN